MPGTTRLGWEILMIHVYHNSCKMVAGVVHACNAQCMIIDSPVFLS